MSDSVRRGLAVVLAAAAFACSGTFLYWFTFEEAQNTDWLWLAGIVLWSVAIWVSTRASDAKAIFEAKDWTPLVAFLAVFAACWLPFYDNWRWAFIGDSFGIFGAAYFWAQNGNSDSMLSVHGIDNFYTNLWSIAYSWPMWFAGPSLWWHRVGQLLMACGALAAIHAYYTVVLGRWWSLLLTVATAANYVWIWISYISYQRTDSFIFYYLTLLIGLLLWRRPDRTRLWLALGLIGGLSVFFTPVVWGAVALTAGVCGLRALSQRRIAPLLIYAVSFLIVIVPITTETEWMLQMLGSQTIPTTGDGKVIQLGMDYYVHIFSIIMMAPYYTPIDHLGVHFGMMRVPLSHSYFAGLAFALIAAIPPIRRRLRIPAVAPVLLILLILDAILFTLTNKGYGAPSHKRFYNLIPLEMFFAILPFYAMAQWTSAYRVISRAIFVFTVAGAAYASYLGFQVILYPPVGMYGSNPLDGLIEIRQRFADHKVIAVTRDTRVPEAFHEDDVLNMTYHVSENVRLQAEVSEDDWKSLCEKPMLFCYEHNREGEYVAPMLAAHPELKPVTLLNTTELRCFRCTLENATP